MIEHLVTKNVLTNAEAGKELILKNFITKLDSSVHNYEYDNI